MTLPTDELIPDNPDKEDPNFEERFRNEQEKRKAVSELADNLQVFPIRDQLLYVATILCMRSEDDYGKIRDYNLAVAAAILRNNMDNLTKATAIADLWGPQ